MMFDSKNKLIVILGPTATGKTKLGVKLSLKFNGEIVSADSRQVYKGMNIGTGKDLAEYIVKVKGETIKTPYHLIDVVSPRQRFDLAKYQKLAFRAIKDILKRDKVPFLVGGTGLYIQAVVDNYDLTSGSPDKSLRKKLEKLSLEELLDEFAKTNNRLAKGRKNFLIKDFSFLEKNKRRIIRYIELMKQKGKPFKEVFTKNKPLFETLLLGITFPQEILHKRIDKRLKERLEKEDMAGEVWRLHEEGVSWKRLEEFGLEYKWLSWYLRGKIGYQEMFAGLSRDIKKFAKRQMTWFKRDKRIIWIKNYQEAQKLVKGFLGR